MFVFSLVCYSLSQLIIIDWWLLLKIYFKSNFNSSLTFLFSIQFGSEFEDQLFKGLQSAMEKKNIQNTVVFSGLKIKNADLSEKGEFDFIIISLPLKSIVQIEAKKGNNEKNRQHADTQLNRGKKFFEENFPFPRSENWEYIKMMCLGESVTADICKNCQKFVLSANFVSSAGKTQTISKEISNQFTSILNIASLAKGTYFKGILIEVN
jgi:hypothetical protein